MGLFSFSRTKKQRSTTGTPGFTSRSEEESHAYRERSSRSKKPDGAAQASSETALPEKKRARRRLIGAIALVLAVIIGLPMLFDSEQKSVADDIAIQIPSMDTPAAPALPVPPAAPGASSSGPVSAATALSQQEEIIETAPAPLSAGAAAQPAADGAPQQPAAEARPAPKPEPLPKPEVKLEPKPEPVPKPEVKPEPKPEPKPKLEVKQESRPEPRQLAKTDETTRARAILEGQTHSAVPEKAASKFTLQVAALTSQEMVDELQGKLKGAGVNSYTQKIATQSGARIRVRVGPFASKEEAEKMRAKLVKLGFGGTLVPAS